MHRILAVITGHAGGKRSLYHTGIERHNKRSDRGQMTLRVKPSRVANPAWTPSSRTYLYQHLRSSSKRSNISDALLRLLNIPISASKWFLCPTGQLACTLCIIVQLQSLCSADHLSERSITMQHVFNSSSNQPWLVGYLKVHNGQLRQHHPNLPLLKVTVC